MYTLTEQQITFIENDIASRGITLEDLKSDILDHVCCIIESEYNGIGDFEEFYSIAITKFYNSELSEIERETVLQLTFKNYYVMKKMMIYSGAFSVGAFLIGTVFKTMHWPGAAVLLVLAILTATLIFLPLTFLLKRHEESTSRDKLIYATGTFTVILFCLGVLFRIQHWPGSLIMWISSIAISFLVFIPLYFFNGIKKPETKINTIVFSVLLVLATGIQFALININPASRQNQLRMYGYLQNDELISRIQKNHASNSNATIARILENCDQIKKLIIQNAIGVQVIPADFESRNLLIDDGSLGTDFSINNTGSTLVLRLKYEVEKFNSSVEESKRIPVVNSIFDIPSDKLFSYSNSFAINSISQIEMFALLSE